MSILLIVLVAFLIWPGSLIIFGYISETKRLHGHTCKYCKNNKCKYLKYVKRKTAKGYYVYEYQCSCSACKIDGSYDIYINNKEEAYDEKLIEFNKSFENKLDFEEFLKSEDNYEFFWELKSEDTFKIIIKNKNKEELIKLFLKEKIKCKFMSSLIYIMIKENDKLINKYTMFLLDNYLNYYKIKNHISFYCGEVKNYLIHALEVSNFEIAKKLTKYVEKELDCIFVINLLELFNKLSDDEKVQLKDILDSPTIQFSIDYDCYKMLKNPTTELLIFFKKYITDYCIEQIVDDAINNNSILELEKIIIVENDINNFINKNPKIIFKIIKNKQMEILEWFKDKKVSFDVRNEEGISPLMYAIVHRDSDLFNWLLDCKININYVDKYGDTVLSYICYQSRFKLAKLLYDKYGARLYIDGSKNKYFASTEKFIEKELYNSFEENKKSLMPYVPCTYYILKKSKKKK